MGWGFHAAASGNERVSTVTASADQSSSLCDVQRRTMKIMSACAYSSSFYSHSCFSSEIKKDAGLKYWRGERRQKERKKRQFEAI
jgi:hypothetical protein